MYLEYCIFLNYYITDFIFSYDRIDEAIRIQVSKYHLRNFHTLSHTLNIYLLNKGHNLGFMDTFLAQYKNLLYQFGMF